MPTAKDVAQYILSKQDVAAEDTISNLKLQKLVYYAQGFTLAMTNEPLFNEKIEAWDHGPVVPALYHEYKGYKGGSIPPPAEEDIQKVQGIFSDQQKEIIDEVLDVYGQFSAWKLRNLSHEDEPWINHHEKVDTTIYPDEMKNYFKQLLVNNGKD